MHAHTHTHTHAHTHARAHAGASASAHTCKRAHGRAHARAPTHARTLHTHSFTYTRTPRIVQCPKQHHRSPASTQQIFRVGPGSVRKVGGLATYCLGFWTCWRQFSHEFSPKTICTPGGFRWSCPYDRPSPASAQLLLCCESAVFGLQLAQEPSPRSWASALLPSFNLAARIPLT